VGVFVDSGTPGASLPKAVSEGVWVGLLDLLSAGPSPGHSRSHTPGPLRPLQCLQRAIPQGEDFGTAKRVSLNRIRAWHQACCGRSCCCCCRRRRRRRTLVVKGHSASLLVHGKERLVSDFPVPRNMFAIRPFFVVNTTSSFISWLSWCAKVRRKPRDRTPGSLIIVIDCGFLLPVIPIVSFCAKIIALLLSI
jgi:hypothetical protein